MSTNSSGFPGEIFADGPNYGALIALVSPYLLNAVQETGESGFIAVLEGPAIRYLNKVLPKREILFDRDIVPTRPAHKVASGVVLLASGSDADVEAYAEASSLSEDEQSKLQEAVAIALSAVAGLLVGIAGFAEAQDAPAGYPADYSKILEGSRSEKGLMIYSNMPITTGSRSSRALSQSILG